MSSNQNLNCYRCEKIATVFIPYNNRVLCDTHLTTFKEAYGFVNFSSIIINQDNIDAINELVPKQATQVSDLEPVIEKTHEVPVQLIVDHLGELAIGVEPATCKVCRKPMQLHSQFSTTKQKDETKSATAKTSGLTDKELQEAARPGFLANFADGGRGVCLSCGGTGLHTFAKPSDIKTIYKHLNDDGANSGHYHQLMDWTDRLKDINLEISTKGNLPFYITKYHNFEVNPSYDPKYLSQFPFSLEGYQELDFTDKPHQVLHTLFHALGELNTVLQTNHGHADVETLEQLYGLGGMPETEALTRIQSPFCSSCSGHGEHPLRRHPDFEEYLQELTSRAGQPSRDEVRRRKPTRTFDPVTDAGVIDLSQLGQREGHAGPNIKPHDHHNKPHTYKKHQQSPGSPSSSGGSGSSQVRRKSPSSGGGGKGRGGGGKGRGKGSNPFALVPRKRTLFEKFPIEKWIYNAMNAVHDMTHTVYENPSYMYRNPNPMYYSVPRAQWGMAKPWRN